MRTQTPSKPVLFASALRTIVLGVFAIILCLLSCSLLVPAHTDAATNGAINFQARLETASGAIAADGNYNVEFKLYSASSGGVAEWTEDYLNNNSQGVHVVNGYLTVNLGSITSFPGTINWNQQQWLTMNIGNTNLTCTPFSSCSPDGEMSPRLLLTATPYAFAAGTLSATNGANVGTLSWTTPTATDSISLPDASGTVCLQNATACGFAPSTGGAGYVQLQGSTPGTAQTGHFNITGTGIAGTLQASTFDTATSVALALGGTNASSINIGNTGSNIQTTINGTALIKSTAANSTTAFQVQNASSAALLNIDTSTTTNLVANGDFESGDLISGWSALVGGTLSPVTTQAWQGNGSLQDATGAVSGQGADYSVSLTSTTQYTLSAYMKVSSGSISDVVLGRQDQGGINNDCGAITITTTWQRFTCTFTTGTTNAGSNIYIRKTGGSAETFFIDGVQLQAGATATAFDAGGKLQLNGIVNSPAAFKNTTDSTAAFQIQNASGTSILGVDSADGTITIGSVPPANTTLPLLQVGSSGLTSGNANGTFLGLNASGSYTGDLVNIQQGGSSVLQILSNTAGNDGLQITSGSTGAAVQLNPTLGAGGAGNGGINIYSNNSGNIAINSMSGNVTINGNFAGDTSSVTIGNTNSNSGVTLQAGSGTGNILLTGVAATTYTVGATTTTGLTTIGQSTASNTISIGAANTATGNTQTINIANGTDAGTGDALVTIGNINGASATTIQGGTGNINLNGNVYAIANNNNSTAPVQMSATGTTGAKPPIWVTVQGKYAYVIEAPSGASGILEIFDVDNVSAPASVGTLTLAGQSPSQIQVQGKYVYIAIQGSGNVGLLQIVDVSNPASPTSVSTISTGSTAGGFGIYVSGRYAYVVANNTNTLVIFDISSPSHPVLISTTSTQGSSPRKVYVQGNYAYISDGGTGAVETVDVSNPYSPVDKAQKALNLTLGDDVCVQGRYVYVTELQVNGELEVFDFKSPTAAPAGAVYQSGTGGAQNAYAYACAVAGRYLITSSGASSSSVIQIDDFSTPSAPTVLQTYSTGLSDPRGIFFDGKYLYIANKGGNNLIILNMSGLEATSATIHSLEAGTLSVDTNANIAGDLELQGGLGVGGALQVNGGFGATGPASFIDSVNSTTAFQIQNAGGEQLLNVDTTNTANLITNPGFEFDTTGWAATGTGAAIARNTTASNTYFGQTSLQVTTGTTANSGARVSSFTATLSAATYTLSFYAMGSTAFSDLGVTLSGGGTGSCTLNSNLIITTAFQRYTCTIVASATINNITIGESGTTSHVFYLDGVQLVQASSASAYGLGAIQLRAPITNPATFKSASNSTTAFQVQNASGSNLLSIDSSNNRISLFNSLANIATPGTITLTTTGTGLTGIFKYEVTAIDSAGGETNVSAEATSANLANQGVKLSWTPVSGASGYNIYRTTAGGGSGTEKFLTSIVGAQTAGSVTYTDSGSQTLSTTITPISGGAYASTNTANSTLQLTVGGNGKPTGQLYVSGTAPVLVGSYIGTTGTNVDAPQSIQVQGRYMYVISINSGAFSIFDISNPASPALISNTTANMSGPRGIYVAGKYAYIVSANGGTNSTLGVWDISNPASPTFMGSTAAGLAGSSYVYVQGRYAYVTNQAANSNNLCIFDVSNPSAPTLVGQITPTGANQLSNVYVQGRYAYIADYSNAKIDIVDVSNPTAPSLTGQVAAGTQWVTVQGRYAYSADFDGNNLVVIDVSNPAGATVVSTTKVTSGGSANGANQVFVQGRYAYVTDVNHSDITVFDISNPASPVSIGSTSARVSSPISLYVQGRYLYEGNNSNQINVYDIGGAYVQQLEAGGLSTATLNVDTNGSVNGNFTVQGGLVVSQNLQAAGNVSINGGLAGIGSAIFNGGLNRLGTPAAPTVTAQGTTGATNYTYVITALNAYGGETLPSGNGSISNGNATLSTTNKNHITWSAVTGASGYKIYRTVGGASQGLVGEASGTSFDDTGVGAANGSVPTVDSSGQLTVAGSALFQSATNSTTAFQIQDASSNNLLVVDTSGYVITIAGTTSTFVRLTLTNAHFKSTQTTAPTIGTPANCGTSPSASITAGSTDSAGSFSITAGTPTGTTCDTIITFNKAYGAAPKAILLTPSVATGQAKQMYVSAASTTTFTVTMNVAPANGEVNTYYYWIIE